MTEQRPLMGWVEESVDKGATTVEEIHRAIAELPLTMMEQNGVLAETAADVRKIQESSITAVYDLIRDVNHKVVKLAGELLETRRPSEE